MFAKLVLTLSALLLLVEGTAGRELKGTDNDGPNIIRWFTMLQYSPGTAIQEKADATKYALSKCAQYFIRASVGTAPGYEAALWNRPTADLVVVMDFAKSEYILPFDRCIDENNPPETPVILAENMIADYNIAFNLSLAYSAPTCKHWPGACVGKVVQVEGFKVKPNPLDPAPALAALETVTKAVDKFGLYLYQTAGPDTTLFPAVGPPQLADLIKRKYHAVQLTVFEDVHTLRAYSGLLQGPPGPVLPEYASFLALQKSTVAVQWTPQGDVQGTDRVAP